MTRAKDLERTWNRQTHMFCSVRVAVAPEKSLSALDLSRRRRLAISATVKALLPHTIALSAMEKDGLFRGGFNTFLTQFFK